MSISLLELVNFRNYSKKALEFASDTTLVVGPNGAGKSNILEAIYLLSTGSSWRTAKSEEAIDFDYDVAHIRGEVQSDIRLHITLTRGIINGKRTPRVSFKINGVGKSKSNFTGQLKAVLFEPESLDIVVGDPGARRAFLDEVLTQTDRDYDRSLGLYAKALRARNKLLDRIREGKERIEVLEYWERALVKHGGSIQQARKSLVEWIDSSLRGRTLAPQGPTFPELNLTYKPNIISQARLDQYRDRETAAGFTFVGPQRDEIRLQEARGKRQEARGKRQDRELRSFGSRGAQRMAVLKLKLLEAEWIEQETGEKPAILLDDIFSELDEEHEKLVGELVKGRQAIITATEIHRGHYPCATLIRL